MRSLSLVLLASTSIFFAAGGSGPVFAASAAPTQDEATIPSSVTAAPSANDEAQTPATPQVAPGLPQKLQDTITTKIADAIERKEDRTAVQGFYTQRNFQPIWIENGALTAGAKSAIEVLRSAKSEGLDPADYPTPDVSAKASEDEQAAAELKLTRSVLAYARHLSQGRVSYTRVSGSILYPAHAPDAGQILSQLAASKNVQETLLSFEPPHQGYKALKAELAKEMSSRETSPVVDAESAREAKGKKSKPQKVAVHSKKDKIALLIANMERWRWVPRDLGHSYVLVNIPDYALKVVNNGQVVWTTKIVAGKPDMATPLLSETMKYITVNPTWNVPPSIIRNEYLPALQRDPDALERIGLKVGHNKDGSLRVYQPPGPKNALGRIRFNFPNPFLVYQHDTPNKHLFSSDQRDFSHGCMRVQNPEKYAEVLLSLSQPNDGITAERVRSYYGDDERTIHLKNPIPVHIVYQTAYFEDGKLRTRPDVYGIDAAVAKLMDGSEKAVADKPIPRDYESSSKPVAARLPARSARTVDDDEGSSRRSRSYDGWNGEREAYSYSYSGSARYGSRAGGFGRNMTW